MAHRTIAAALDALKEVGRPRSVQLAVLIDRGHQVSVLTPSSKETVLPDFAVSSGKAVAIPYNGSVSRLSFGPKAFGRLRKWIRKGEFDVLHVHEPNAPSLGMLALAIADGPIVATFHTSTEKSLVLSVFQSVLRPSHEKIRGKIAVSELARRWQMESLGSDAIEIPNGVDVRAYDTEDLWGAVGLVPQRGYLFSGTVADNLRYGKADADDDEMWDALRVAAAARRTAGPAGHSPTMMSCVMSAAGASMSRTRMLSRRYCRHFS